LYYACLLTIAKHVLSCNIFDTIEQNDAFFELLNYAAVSNGSFPVVGGICKDLCAYSHVKMNERAGTVSPPSIDPHTEEYVTLPRRRRAIMASEMTWKDDYLALRDC